VVINESVGEIYRCPIEIDILERSILGAGLHEIKKVANCRCDGDHDQIAA
jgi:hypothetical protein